MPELVVVDRAFRDRYGRRPGPTPATSELHLAPGAGEGLRTHLLAAADAATLDGWLPPQRPDPGAGASWEERRRTMAYVARLRRALAQRIVEHRWPAWWEDPVLPWFRLDGDRSGAPGDPWKELDDAAPHRADQLRTAWGASPGRHPDDAPTAAPAAPSRSRDALRGLLVDHGLGEQAPSLAEAARPGFVLTRADSSEVGVSRIAGPALLPDGVSWPVSEDGVPLTFVAAVDLSDLPPHVDELPLPNAGTLLFYVLVGDRSAWGGVPPWGDDPGPDPVAVFHVPAGGSLVVATPPPGGVQLERDPEVHGHDEAGDRPAAAFPLRFEPVVHPLLDYGVADRFGLHPADVSTYESIAQVGFDPPDDETAIAGLLLGVPAGPQGHPVSDDEVLLLALRGTPRLGTDWGIEGDLRVVIGRDDLVDGRWDRAFAMGDS